MDRSPALLLLLALGLCCPGIHGQSLEIKVESPKDITQLRVGQTLELECETGKDSGAFWIRQDKSGSLHFIVFINSMSRATFSSDQRTSPERFEASKHNTLFRLVVKSFTPQDEGKYFCMMNFNQIMYFSRGQPAFLPVTTTLAPTTCGPTPKRGITEDTNRKTPDPERMQEELNFSCNIFIWVPLAGACLLLLIVLVITIVLSRQTRRRRCRCKR
ncbi:CD8A protein, partial [Eulacestoma nigropectus]|nr:CD8A protein [Eulacestoma nigropectus]